MPNWCNNKLSVYGPADDLKGFVKAARGPLQTYKTTTTSPLTTSGSRSASVADDSYIKLDGNAIEALQKFAKESGLTDALEGRSVKFRAIEERHPTWSFTCEACPVQAEGKLDDGRIWYFRSRGDFWYMAVSKGPSDNVGDAVDGERVITSDDLADDRDGFEGSWLEPEDAEMLISLGLEKLNEPKGSGKSKEST